jgi:putative MATE family efflux protein
MQLNPTYRDILKVGVPVMIGNMAHGITQAVDTAFMARVGVNDVNATLLAGMTFFFLAIIALGFTRGTQILIARRTGEGNYRGVGQVFDQLLLKGIVLSVFIFGTVLLFRHAALPFMIASEEILDKAGSYLDIRIWVVPLTVFNLILIAFYTGIGKTTVISVSTVVISVVNIILDYILIFGKFGAPAMGVEGASLATSIAEVTGSFVLVGALIYNRDFRTFNLFSFPSINWKLYGQMFTLSWPIVFQHILGMGAWYLFFLMIEKIGEEELAISSVIKSLYMVIGIPIWGLGSAINTVVSNLLGQKRMEHVIPATTRSVHISFSISFTICLFLFLFPRFFLGMYSSEIAAMPEAIPTLYVIVGTMMLFSVGSMTMHSVMGIGDTRMLLIFESVAIICYVLYCYLAVFRWELSLPRVWMAEFVYWTLLPLMTITYLGFGPWRKVAARY